jgi:hypothetical protein
MDCCECSFPCKFYFGKGKIEDLLSTFEQIEFFAVEIENLSVLKQRRAFVDLEEFVMLPFIFIEARIFDIANLIWQINKIPSYFM